MIPNRFLMPLDAVEQLAEAGDQRRLADIARETRNWPLVNVLKAVERDAREARRDRRKPSRGLPYA